MLLSHGSSRSAGACRLSWRRAIEVFGEMLERAQHRERRHAAQRAQRAVQHRVAQVAQQRDRLPRGSRPPRCGRSPRRRASSRCGRACTCRRTRWRRTPSRSAPCCAMSTVSSNATMPPWPTIAPIGGEGFVVERRVELRLGKVGAERPADLHRADRPAGGRAAAEVVQQLAQRDAEGLLDQAAVLDVAGELERQACRASGPCRSRGRTAAPASRMIGTTGERDHVVDHRRLAEQALDRRQRRLEAHLAALAFQAFEQRGLLAADVGAGAAPHLEVERACRCRADACRAVRRPWPAAMAAFERALARADTRSAGRCSPAWRRRRRRRWSCPRSARTDRLPSACGRRTCRSRLRRRCRRRTSGGPRLPQHRLPLDAGREGRAAAAAQARVGHFLDDRLAGRSPARRASPRSRRAHVVVERQRIDDADAREGEALLVLEVRDLVRSGRGAGDALPPWRQAGVEQIGHVLQRDRDRRRCGPRGRDFDQRLEPEHAARAVAHDLDVDIAPGGFARRSRARPRRRRRESAVASRGT